MRARSRSEWDVPEAEVQTKVVDDLDRPGEQERQAETGSDGGAGVIPSMVATLLGLPYLSNAADIEPAGEGRVRVRRLSPTGFDVIEAPMPALIMGTQLLGAPRYPSLRGIMQARSKEVETLDLAALAIDPATVGQGSAGTKVIDARTPPPRGAGDVVREAPDVAVERMVAFLADRGLL